MTLCQQDYNNAQQLEVTDHLDNHVTKLILSAVNTGNILQNIEENRQVAESI